jgi:hypothetical protein
MPYKDIEKRRAKNKIYQKVYYEKNKKYYIKKAKDQKKAMRQIILEIKKKSKCSKCGMSDYRCLDFHHKQDKKFNISFAYTKGVSIGTLMKEIEGCEILCRNCHSIYHYKENQNGI